jgi:hypothetical protein
VNKALIRRSLPLLCGLALAGQAHAQATRTWVSGVGDDVNPCSRTAPCKTFAGAISKTATGGEIDVLDPGGFGAVTITKAITIASEGAGEGGIAASGVNGIVVNAPTGSQVHLRGLQIDGYGTGLNGIRVIGGDVHVENCVIRNFRGGTGAGISNEASVASRVFVANSVILGNLIGISSTNTAGSPVVLQDTIIDRNSQFGIKAVGAFGIYSLNRTTVLGSPVGISAPSPAKVQSYGNNAINNLEAGTVLTPLSLQ